MRCAGVDDAPGSVSLLGPSRSEGSSCRRSDREGRGTSVAVVAFGTTLAMPMACLGMPVAGDVPTLIACEAVFSCAYPVSNVSLQALRVSLVSPGMQGRVNATYRAVVFGFARFGLAGGGLVFGDVGPRNALRLSASVRVAPSRDAGVRVRPHVSAGSAVTVDTTSQADGRGA